MECFKSIQVSGTVCYPPFSQDRKEGLSPLVWSFLLGSANVYVFFVSNFWSGTWLFNDIDAGHGFDE